jgi:elongation factor G
MNGVASFRPDEIRNIVLLGHAGAGKTTLAEAILHRGGAITRMGSIETASTAGDFEPEARAHGHSTSSTLLFATYQGREINLIDTPGSPEFVGQALAALPAVETAVIVVNAATGIELNTRRLFHAAGELGLARMIVVNRIDLAYGGPAGVGSLATLVRELKDNLGPELHCINLPTSGGKDVIDCFDLDAGDADFASVADVHREMLESTIEVDDAALERYLGGETIDLAHLRRCFVEAMNRGHVVPILFTAAKDEVGIDDLLHILVEEAPSPTSARPRRLRRGEDIVDIPCDPDAPLLAHVFKVTTDPYLGKLAMLRILQGRIDASTQFLCGDEKKPQKAGHVLKVEGRDHPELESMAFAGDLVALAKVEDIHTGQILHGPGTPNLYRPLVPRYPQPMYSLAIEPKNKNDEVKLSAALARLTEEDPTLQSGHDPQTRELVVSGLGELHLRVALEKLENRFHVALTAKQPKIAYRETVTARAEGHYRHKKQTGGAGQFGEVFVRIEPLPRGAGAEFANETYGGSIPHQFIPSCEKGFHDGLESGLLAGYPVHDVRFVVYDGKSHPVDSKDVAFRTAAKFAFRDAFNKARPVLLEPIATLDITTPERFVGDVTADLKVRRGRVIGVDAVPATGFTVIHAQAPLAELGQYSGQLRSLTGGAGSFVMEPSHYDYVPEVVQRKLMAGHVRPRDEE